MSKLVLGEVIVSNIMNANNEVILILDFGSQYNQLIARRIRESKVFCQIVTPEISAKEILKINPKGLIFSGGPASVYQRNAPRPDKKIFQLGIPILGICYGLQIIAHMLGGKVASAKSKEYGLTNLKINDKQDLFYRLPNRIITWMSHGDYISRLPPSFKKLAHTSNTRLAVIANREKKIYGLQFHPEVTHTPQGGQVLKNFLYRICRCQGNWTMRHFLKEAISSIRSQTQGQGTVLGLSGGVDSSVAAVLLHKAIGKKLSCIFVDNGLLRKGERRAVVETFVKHFHINLHCVNAQKRFLKKLRGISDPERKRKIIGREFIAVFEKEAREIGKIKFLAQGTLYPDVIESRSSFGAPSATIKTHHNVGGLPKTMNLKLIEPLKDLFKDEVRVLGKEMGLPDEIITRHPFPGPGLAVRIIGAVSEERLNILREVDARFIEEIKKANLYHKIWQAFAVLLPVKSVGVMGDERTYENVVALRAVTSFDGMTADWARIPNTVLGKISNIIINEVSGVNRVVYDISSKPPSTIEWE